MTANRIIFAGLGVLVGLALASMLGVERLTAGLGMRTAA